MRLVLATSILFLSACAGGSTTEPAAQDMDVNGLSVVIASDAPFTRSPDFAPRLESTIQVGLEYWGGQWTDVQGRTLTFTGAADVGCGVGGALGCFDGDLRISTRDPGAGTFACLEQTVLVHELGHVVLGDPDHLDPRWMDLQSVGLRLAGRVGYTDEGVVDPCVVYVSVWRHPLGTP